MRVAREKSLDHSTPDNLQPGVEAPVGSAQWKAEREAEEMKGERRQAHGDDALTGEGQPEPDANADDVKVALDLGPGMNI